MWLLKQAAEQQVLERRLAAMAREVAALNSVKEMLSRERETLLRQSVSLHDWLTRPKPQPPKPPQQAEPHKAAHSRGVAQPQEAPGRGEAVLRAPLVSRLALVQDSY